jgi:hypothetical protein
MATYNLFLNASQADTAITNAYRLFDSKGLTGQNILLYGGNIENFGSISTRTLRATGNGLNSSYIQNLTGGIRVEGVSQIPSITNGISITGGTYLDYVYGGLRVNGATIVTGTFTNLGATTHSGPVFINGTTRVTGLLNVTGNLDVNGNVDISGSSFEVASNDIRLRGATIIESNTIIQGNLDVRGDYFLDGIPFSGGSTTYIFESGSIFTGVTGSQGGGGITQGRYQEYDLVPNIEFGTGSLAFNGGSVGASGATRGEYAIDTQILRRYSNQVAAAPFSILLGGQENRNNGTYGSVIGGLLNTGNGAGSVILGGSLNLTNATYSVAFGIKAKAYNRTELVQGTDAVQRGWLLGFYDPAYGDQAFRWGDFQYLDFNTGITLQSTAFIKFRICTLITGSSSFSEKEFSIVAASDGSVSVTQGNSSGYSLNNNIGSLTIESSGTNPARISADIMYVPGFVLTTTPAPTTSSP